MLMSSFQYSSWFIRFGRHVSDDYVGLGQTQELQERILKLPT